MHIFNLDNKPYIIISSKELLFRHHNLDEQMQRVSFSQIKEISVIHRYNAKKELFIWLNVQTTLQHKPYLIQISLLNEPLEDFFHILQNELNAKVKLKLPKHASLSRLRNFNKGFQRLGALSFFLLLSLLAYHHYVLPSLQILQTGSSKIAIQKPQGFCSTNVKVAYPTQNKNELIVKNYCGLFGFWNLESSKHVPLKYLDTEFQGYSAKTHIITAKEFVKNKEFDKAIASIDKALYIDPNDPYSHVILSTIYQQQGDKEHAFSTAKTALEHFPKNALAHENIAYLYKNEQNLSAAYEHFEKSSHLTPKASTYVGLAQIQDTQNRKKEALENYEKAVALSADNPQYLTLLGLAYWEAKEFDKAKNSLQKAYTLEPNNPAYFLNYYEVSLVTYASISPEQKEAFIQEYSDDKKMMMVYEMLTIIEDTIKGQDINEAKTQWLQSYQDQKLDWSFSQIRAWLDASDLELEHRQDIQRTLGFFIGHQQSYNLKNNHSQDFK